MVASRVRVRGLGLWGRGGGLGHHHGHMTAMLGSSLWRPRDYSVFGLCHCCRGACDHDPSNVNAFPLH